MHGKGIAVFDAMTKFEVIFSTKLSRKGKNVFM